MRLPEATYDATEATLATGNHEFWDLMMLRGATSDATDATLATGNLEFWGMIIPDATSEAIDAA